jgi:hypothetical protein
MQQLINIFKKMHPKIIGLVQSLMYLYELRLYILQVYNNISYNLEIKVICESASNSHYLINELSVNLKCNFLAIFKMET